MRRKVAAGLGLAAVVASLWAFGGCTRQIDPWGDAESPRVVVTIAPLYSFVRGVAGDRAAIRCLCTTTGPHHYQIDSRDPQLFPRADVFFAVGLRLDDFFADALVSMAHRRDLPPVKLGQKLEDLLRLKHEHRPGDEGSHNHKHGKWDPHVWLGVPEVIGMVAAIRGELCAKDPENAELYRKNAEAYTNRLRRLHEDGKALLAGKKVKRIVSFHEALGYFARSFGLEIADVIEPGPGDEPTQGHMKEIVELCRDPERPIGAITVEPQYPKTSSAQAIQKALKGKVPLVEIDPLETAVPSELEKEGAGWYEARMRRNLEALASKLP
jgi:zinc transport system substrate-binding protein